MHQALYGSTGFYLRERPHQHFRTSVHASHLFADAVLCLLERVDGALGRPPVVDLVDVGAGTGLLAARVLAAAPPELADRLRITAVELSPRPDGLDGRIAWTPAVPDRVEGLIVANEWLDNVPLDIVERTSAGPRLVMVDPETGKERLGPLPEPRDLAWQERWWPLGCPGDRAEIGHPRDEAWASVIRRLARGTAVAVDYAHRVDNRPSTSTLAGYRDGYAVPPVPDGACDITAHVALDACAAAGEAAGAVTTTLTTQRDALQELGVRGVRPSLDLAHADPRGYLRALTRSTEEAELIDPHGLGGFGWLTQSR